MKSVEEQIEFLSRGAERIYSVDELRQKLTRVAKQAERLRVKLGVDPTAPDLTLGHTVVLRKMRDFQDCGHLAVLIIGDYTARIGDPTGRSKARPILSDEEVNANAATYLAQAGKVLDLSPERLEVRRNSEWLGPLTFQNVIQMSSQMTVARMLERDTFAKRYKAGVEIYLHEMFYPMMQAYDSVVVRADVELGGTDQTFNNLLGRDYQKNAGQEPQVVVITPILVGLDGSEKMSKSAANFVAVAESPAEMFAKLLSIPDSLMLNYFELLTRKDAGQINDLLNVDRTHPRDAKVALAKDVVAQYHDTEAAESACVEFFKIHGAGQQGVPDEMPELSVPASLGAIDLVVRCGFAKSNSEARRLISENGVRLNGEVIGDPLGSVSIETGSVIQRGKRKFLRLIVNA